MTTLEAYFAWKQLAPMHHVVPAQSITYSTGTKIKTFVEPSHYNGDCCVHKHVLKDADGNEYPAPDEHKVVCDRERAWRRYVRIRDGVAAS